MVDVPLSPKRYKTIEQRNNFDRTLLENVVNLPGVESVAIGNGGMPFGGPRSSYSFEGQAPAEDKRIVLGLDQQRLFAHARDSAQTRSCTDHTRSCGWRSLRDDQSICCQAVASR